MEIKEALRIAPKGFPFGRQANESQVSTRPNIREYLPHEESKYKCESNKRGVESQGISQASARFAPGFQVALKLSKMILSKEGNNTNETKTLIVEAN